MIPAIAGLTNGPMAGVAAAQMPAAKPTRTKHPIQKST
jgi:hypothetical protein